MRGPVEETNSPVFSGSQRDVDFSDYMWMGEEMEEFDKKCIQEFCEQDFIESCFEELFEEEDRFAEELEAYLENLTPEQVNQLVHQLDAATLKDVDHEKDSSPSSGSHGASRLNPHAPAFIPVLERGDKTARPGNE